MPPSNLQPPRPEDFGLNRSKPQHEDFGLPQDVEALRKRLWWEGFSPELKVAFLLAGGVGLAVLFGESILALIIVFVALIAACVAVLSHTSPLTHKYGDPLGRYLEAKQQYDAGLINAQQQYRNAQAAYQERQLRNQQYFWHSLDGIQFEREIAKLFAQLGYSTQLTPTSGDKGIDILMWKDSKKTVVQCKAHRDPVGPSVIRELYGSMFHAEAQEAKLVACGGFTQGVYTFAKGKPIELLDLNAILHLQQQVQPRPPSAPNSTTDSSRTAQPLDDTSSEQGEKKWQGEDDGTALLCDALTEFPVRKSTENSWKMNGLTDLELDTALRQSGFSEQVIQSIMEKRKKTR